MGLNKSVCEALSSSEAGQPSSTSSVADGLILPDCKLQLLWSFLQNCNCCVWCTHMCLRLCSVQTAVPQPPLQSVCLMWDCVSQGTRNSLFQLDRSVSHQSSSIYLSPPLGLGGQGVCHKMQLSVGSKNLNLGKYSFF